MVVLCRAQGLPSHQPGRFASAHQRLLKSLRAGHHVGWRAGAGLVNVLVLSGPNVWAPDPGQWPFLTTFFAAVPTVDLRLCISTDRSLAFHSFIVLSLWGHLQPSSDGGLSSALFQLLSGFHSRLRAPPSSNGAAVLHVVQRRHGSHTFKGADVQLVLAVLRRLDVAPQARNVCGALRLSQLSLEIGVCLRLQLELRRATAGRR